LTLWLVCISSKHVFIVYREMEKKKRKDSSQAENATRLPNESAGDLFSIAEKKEVIVEKNQDDLTQSLFARIQKNPSIVLQLHEVLDVIDDDKEKGRNYKRKWESAYHEVPLDDISIDLENFQNRRTAYSEYSVQGIIDAIRSNTFKKALFSPCILWKSSTGENFVLAGHSRNEAFRRLREIYDTDPQIQQWCHIHNYYFDTLPCLYINDINFEDAKAIALMSNALATAEMDVERANVYRCMKKIGKSNHEIESFWRKCEKSNRSRIRSYAHLAENGLATDTLYRFEMWADQTIVIKRIAYRLGELRRKHHDVSDIHEKELFDWLMNKWVYGKNKNKWEIHTMDVFIDVVERHIEQLKNNNEFSADNLLNINRIKDLSYTMKYYYETLEIYRSKKKVIMEDFHTLRRKLSQLKAINNIPSEKRDILRHLEEELNISFNAINNCEDIHTGTDLLFAMEEVYLNPDEEIIKCEQKQAAILKEMRKVEEDYYAFRNKKDIFQEANKKVIKMEI